MPENSVRLLGRYALHGEIAVGGMATVHFGRLYGAIGFSRTVAIKRLHKQYARDAEFVSMFLDEARLAARIRHPNVVPTLDVVATDGELFVVMEYVHGESLSKLIRSEARAGRTIPPPIAASILSATLQGLHAAHEARDERGQPLSIVHRDVSPQNILVGADGVARVLDFGVAKAAGRIHTTRQGQIKGKLPYMAPEQLSANASVNRLVDVYAASVCLWEALTGHRLFAGDNEGIVLGRVLSAVVEPPSHYAPHISPELDQVALRGLSRVSTERFATAREMAVAIERAVGRVATGAEICDWMEQVAGPALAARHHKVAEIELQTDKASSEQMLSEISSMRKAYLPDANAAPPGPPGPPRPAAPTPMEGLRPSGVAEVPRSPPSASSPNALSEISAQSQLSHFAVTTSQTAAERRRLYSTIGLLAVFTFLAIGLVVLFGAAIYAARQRAAARATPTEDRASATAPSAPSSSATATIPAAPVPVETPSAESAPAPTPKPARTAPKAPTKRDCEPPYTVDSNGRKRFKPECF